MIKKYITFKALSTNTNNVEIIDGLKFGLKPPLKADNMNTNAEQLVASAWAACMHSTLRFLLSLDKKTNKSEVLVEVDLVLDREIKEYFFNLHGYIYIEDMTTSEIDHYLNLTHQKCPVSKLINKSKTVYLTSSSEPLSGQ